MTTTDAEGIMGGPPSVYVLMGLVLRDLPAIGKNQVNAEQRFNFRGYDDVLNGLNPILSRHGVFIVPDVIERIVDRRATRNGGVMYEVNLHVRYRFYGPAGDYVEASGWGEGTDMGDKATNKAMTNALKYVLFQTFAISTEETSQIDSDRHTPEESVPDQAQCKYCPITVKGARTEREPMRVHMIDAHGWVRQDDGTVLTPEMHAAKIAAMTAEADSLGEGSQVPDEAQTAPEPTPVAAPAATPPVRATPPATPPAPDPDPTPPAPAAPPVSAAPDPVPDPTPEPDPAPAVTETEPDPDGGQEDTGWECPFGEGTPDACTEPPFATEEEYFAHWAAAHGDGDDRSENADLTLPSTEPAPAPAGGDDLADLVEAVQTRLTTLSGANARAYGKYRREHGLGRVADLDAAQATALLDFLESLPAA